MDYNAGLTQVLDDGTNTYLYGNGRIVQVNTTTDHFLSDALGSVRQMTNASGAITLAKSYDPYGVSNSTSGSSLTSYCSGTHSYSLTANFSQSCVDGLLDLLIK